MTTTQTDPRDALTVEQLDALVRKAAHLLLEDDDLDSALADAEDLVDYLLTADDPSHLTALMRGVLPSRPVRGLEVAR